MSAPPRIIQSFTGIMLSLLILLISWMAVRQDAAAVPIRSRHIIAHPTHGPAFHKMAAHKDAKHPTLPSQQKHRRTRAHRPTVVKIAVPQVYNLPRMLIEYKESAPMPLTGIYRYVFFREITPPPPKGC